MSAVVLALVLSALLKYASGRGNAVQCLNGCHCDASSNWQTLQSPAQYEDRTENATKWPKGCYCQFTFALTQLSIDCRQSVPLVSDELSRHLGSFLSADYIAKHVKSLSITNTPLTQCSRIGLPAAEADNAESRAQQNYRTTGQLLHKADTVDDTVAGE